MKPVICVAIRSEFSSLPEYDIPILYTGIGKIKATFTLTKYLVENLGKIDTVINVGSAGGILDEDKYKVIECGVFEEGDLEYPNQPTESICNWRSRVKVLTFDKFQTTCPDKPCNLVDMEAYALASVCKNLKISFYSFKYVSDIVGQGMQEEEWIKEHGRGEDKLKEVLIDFFKKNVS